MPQHVLRKQRSVKHRISIRLEEVDPALNGMVAHFSIGVFIRTFVGGNALAVPGIANRERDLDEKKSSPAVSRSDGVHN
jgi:hypothetical protein